MMRILCWIPVLLVVATSAGNGAPVKGARIMPKVHVEAQSKKQYEEVFQGGRRACVIAMGDHKPPVDIGIAVYDEANQLLAEDRGLDYAAVIWYPPRDAKYKIVLTNSGADYNDMYVVFK